MASKGNKDEGARGKPSAQQWAEAGSKSPDDFTEEEVAEAEDSERQQDDKGGHKSGDGGEKGGTGPRRR